MTGRRESDSVEDQVKHLKSRIGKMSWGEIAAWGAMVSTVIGMLWGGFQIWLKVEEIANLDVGAFEQRMELIEQKVTSVDENIYAVKNDLKTDIRRIEKIADSVERSSKEANRDLNNELRAFRQEMKQLDKDVTTRLSETEKALSDKLQKALDNPLAQ